MVLENDSHSEESICDVISDFEKYGKNVSYRQLKSYASENSENANKDHVKRKLDLKLKRSLIRGQIQESTPGNYETVGKGCEGLLRWRRSRSRRLKRLRRRRRIREMQTKACLTIKPSAPTRRRRLSRGRPQKRRRVSRARRPSLRGRKRRRISRSKRKRTSGSVRRRRSRSARKTRRTSRRRISRRRRRRQEIAVV